MKTNIREGTFHLTTYTLIFLFILLQSCASISTSVMHLEGDDLKKNLPGHWEGKWYYRAHSGNIRINILKIDGNKVKLTGFIQGSSVSASSDEVYGRLENSTLLLTWPVAGEGGTNDKYEMKRDNSNNLILDGRWKDSSFTGKVQLKKIE